MNELVISDLTVHYGRAEALRAVTVTVAAGAVTAVVGPNGAGKTTLLNTIAGIVHPSSGSITVDGHSIIGSSPAKLFRSGVALVPEGKHVFSSLTVDDNLRVAAAPFRHRHDADIARCFELFPRLYERRKLVAALLSGGEQQQLMIARALVARPKFLLMDEPSTGLAPLLVQDVLQVARTLANEGVGVLLVEQFVQEAVKISDHVLILAKAQVRREMTGIEAQLALESDEFFSSYSGRDATGRRQIAARRESGGPS
jgi:branched-chain amino acid transport system ATP-binding protein